MTSWRSCQTDDLKKLFLVAATFCAEIESGSTPRWMTLAGQSGCGKTHLAKEIVKWARASHGHYKDENGINVRRDICFVTVESLAQDLKQGIYGRLSDLGNVYLLAIDDIGADRDTSGFLTEQWLRLLNSRLGKWTVITTNLSLNQIRDSYDSRIASRMRRDSNVFFQSTAIDFAERDLNKN